MLQQLATDLRATPNAFQLFPPAPEEVVERALKSLPPGARVPLRAVWELTAGGDAFETEEVYGPGLVARDFERMWDFELINRGHRDAGLHPNHHVFNDGLELTAVNPQGGIVTVDRASYEAVYRWRDLDEWYLSLRVEYGPKYGLPVA